jgi:hypothetical protein
LMGAGIRLALVVSILVVSLDLDDSRTTPATGDEHRRDLLQDVVSAGTLTYSKAWSPDELTYTF